VQHAPVLSALQASPFARAQWAALTARLSRLHRTRTLLQGVRQWVQWLYWQDVLTPGVEVGGEGEIHPFTGAGSGGGGGRSNVERCLGVGQGLVHPWPGKVIFMWWRGTRALKRRD
jgi:hypothetical protein